MKKLHYTTPPVDVGATPEVLLGSAAAGPAGILIGAGSATVRTFTQIGISATEKIREKAEETRKTEKGKGKTQGGPHER